MKPYRRCFADRRYVLDHPRPLGLGHSASRVRAVGVHVLVYPDRFALRHRPVGPLLFSALRFHGFIRITFSFSSTFLNFNY